MKYSEEDIARYSKILEVFARENQFFIDLDEAWQWLEHKSKQAMKGLLFKHFILNTDYIVVNSIKKRIKKIYITFDCLEKLNNKRDYSRQKNLLIELGLLFTEQKTL